MVGTAYIIIGAIAVILALAGFSLLAVWLQNRIGSKSSLPPGCSGEPSLERCRTCRYMQGLGDDSYCSILSRQMPKIDGESDRDGGGFERKES